MITFQSKNSAIRQADRITRRVNSVYPHISESKARKAVGYHLQYTVSDMKTGYKLSNLMLKNSNKIDNLRCRCGMGIDLFENIIDMLKNKKIGNCYEKSMLCQIIGKINGIKNIYPAKIYCTRNSSGATVQLDHVVAVITDIPLGACRKYSYKNKDAVILDPWLGITEFAGDYFAKLRTNFAKLFTGIDDNDFKMSFLAKTSENLAEFNKKRKQSFKPDFYLQLHEDELLTDRDAQILKEKYPELIIK